MKAPEWATHKITFDDSSLVVYYNELQYEGIGEWNDRMTWEDVGTDPERYMEGLEIQGFKFNLKRVVRQVVNK